MPSLPTDLYRDLCGTTMSFVWKGRLGEKPSDLLKHYYADTIQELDFLEALHQWDKAQVVVLGGRPCQVNRDIRQVGGRVGR